MTLFFRRPTNYELRQVPKLWGSNFVLPYLEGIPPERGHWMSYSLPTVNPKFGPLASQPETVPPHAAIPVKGPVPAAIEVLAASST